MTDAAGNFQFFNVPFNTYLVTARHSGFEETAQTAVLRSNVPLELTIQLLPANISATVEITADRDAAIEPTRSEYSVNQTSLNNLTGALASRQIENLVLSVPGTAKDGEGTFHPRGAHYQASFVIDGVPVSDQLSTVYANNFDARNLEDMTVQLGNIAPEFGNKTSAIIQITTPSGLSSGGKFFGGAAVGLGSFAANEASFKLGGAAFGKKFGYFVSGAVNRSSRFVDAPFQSAAAIFPDGRVIFADGRGLHNVGGSQSFFSRFDFVPNERDIFRLNIVAARSRFDVPNLPSQQLAGQDQRQENRNFAVYPSYQRIVGKNAALTIAPYVRISTASADDSPFDTPITFTQNRRLPTYGAVANFVYSNRNHAFKTGIDAFAFPVSEQFSFELTDPAFNPLPAKSVAAIRPDGSVAFQFDPTLTQAKINELLLGFNPNLIAYDRTILAQAAANGSIITGTPRRFSTAPRKTGKQFSAYAQDAFSYKRLTVSGGVRFDRYSFLVTENAVSPRVGASFRLPATNTVLRASYNRISQTPSTENLLTSETDGAATLVNPLTIDLLGGRRILFIPLERANWYEVGAQQPLGRIGRADLAFYAKNIRNLHDNDQFLNTTIIFPIALARGRVRGFDARFEAAEYKNLTGYVSVGTVRVRVQPPFAGGLFLSGATPEDFGSEEFIIDHDQKLNVQGALQYSNKQNGLFAQFLVRYDGGLVTGITSDDLPTLLADPDTAAGVALLNFNTDPVRTKARTIYDFSVGYDFIRRENTRIGVQFDALNFTNVVGLYNYLSVFGGTNYIPARSFNGRLRINF